MDTNSRFIVSIHILALLEIYKDEQPLRSSFIAKSVNTNPVVIRRVLGTLAKAGYIKNQAGGKGGASLKRTVKDISLLEIYQLTKQGELFALHPKKPNRLCPCGRHIQAVAIPIFNEAELAMTSVLKSKTIAHVVKDIHVRLAQE